MRQPVIWACWRTIARRWSVSAARRRTGCVGCFTTSTPISRSPGALDRKVWLERVTRRLGRGEQTVQVRIARDLVRRCKALTRDANELEREIGVRVARYAPQLLSLKGCGALIAAKIISETGGIGRFRNDAQFACLAGVAPIEASSGRQRRHRLSRHGNRQLNSALHKIAVVQGRWDARARVYLERRQAEGKTRREALRALKRHLARVVFRLLREEPGMPPERIKVRGGKVRVPALA
jgi:transposase